jgi:hypothetical protein
LTGGLVLNFEGKKTVAGPSCEHKLHRVEASEEEVREVIINFTEKS